MEFVAVQVIVTLALPDADASTVLVAVTVTMAGEGTAAGAVYIAVLVPVATMVPTVELPPGALLTLQVTLVEAVPVEPPSLPVTVAVNTCAPLVGTLGVAGVTVTTTFGGGGGEDVDLVTPAQADSKIAQMQRTAKHATGTKPRSAPRVTRMRRVNSCPALLRSFASRIQLAKGKRCATAEQTARRVPQCATRGRFVRLSSGWMVS